MLLADAESLALKLMREFGLIRDVQAGDWQNFTFEFDEAKRRFGCCHRLTTRRYRGDGHFETVHKPGGRITLSRELTLLNDQPKVEDVIRHEIAHGLCGPKEGHGAQWKKMCRKVGAKPERCYNEEVETGDSPYSAICAVCGEVYRRFKLPKGDRWCSNKECKHKMLPYVPGEEHGSFHPMRKLIWRHKDAPVPKAEDKRAAIAAMKALLKGEQ
jgi:predicted SprT family Zn-dependent metalloprotease